MARRTYDVVIVGSGAGGATLARELARRGADVCVLERGRYETRIGTYWSAGCYIDLAELPRFVPRRVRKLPILPRSAEGIVLWRALMAGGTTVISMGNAARSMEGPLASLGVSLGAEHMEAEAEMGVAPIHPKLLSSGSKAIRSAAAALGHRMDPMPKFVDRYRCTRCGRCGYGCEAGGKWTALRYLDEAAARGAEVLYDTRVEEVIVEAGRATGVRARRGRERIDVAAGEVVLAAGGLATPALLQRSGVEAGRGFFMDLMWTTYALHPTANQDREPVMALVDLEFHAERGFLLSPFMDQHPGGRMMERAPLRALGSSSRLLGIMTKITDDANGRVSPDESFSKPLTRRDRARLEEGAAIARRILAEAGATGLGQTRIQGAHPGGGAAIGAVVDEEMRTRVPNLRVCDASVFPAAAFPDAARLPPIVTIVALAKRLAARMAREDRPRARTPPSSGPDGDLRVANGASGIVSALDCSGHMDRPRRS